MTKINPIEQEIENNNEMPDNAKKLYTPSSELPLYTYPTLDVLEDRGEMMLV